MPAQTQQQHAAAQAQFAADQEAELKRLVRLCNVARADRGWDENEWLSIKREYADVETLRDADIDGCERILAHAKACGFKVRHKQADGAKSRPIDRTDPARKLRKLWLRGCDLGIIASRDESALCSWASNSRSGNVTALLEAFGPKEWDDAIERLKKWLYREAQAGRMACPNGHHYSIVSREMATSLIWERPIACTGCEAPMAWQPAPKKESRRGRRG